MGQSFASPTESHDDHASQPRHTMDDRHKFATVKALQTWLNKNKSTLNEKVLQLLLLAGEGEEARVVLELMACYGERKNVKALLETTVNFLGQVQDQAAASIISRKLHALAKGADIMQRNLREFAVGSPAVSKLVHLILRHGPSKIVKRALDRHGSPAVAESLFHLALISNVHAIQVLFANALGEEYKDTIEHVLGKTDVMFFYKKNSGRIAGREVAH